MEREKHKEELAKKLAEKDPSVYLVKPEKSSKSCAWSADCFSLIFNNNVKENYVFCQLCSNLITYNSVHGTGSLLRHHCYKKVMCAQVKDASAAGKKIQFTSPSKGAKRPLSKADGDDPLADILLNTPDSLKFQMKFRDNNRQKKDIEELILKGDPSIDMRPPANIKSEVWSNGNFKIVYQYGNKLDFVMCLYCQSLITYKSKTGTASLLRHSCMKKLNSSIKSEMKLPAQDEQLHEIVTLPLSEADAAEDNDMTATSADNVSFEQDSEQEQYLTGEFPDEFKEEAIKLFQYFSYKDMQPTNLSQKKGLISFSQYLVNLGAEYGKINIETILEGRAAAATPLGDNFMNILQKMLKSKFEDHKMALSCDYWHDPNRKLNFLTLYAHYISDMFEMKRANLGTVSFTEEFAMIDYKQLILSILESYFPNEADVEAFLSKTTIVTFDEVLDCLKSHATINCACLTLNRIVQRLIEESGFRELIPSEVLALENWSSIWEYLDMLEDNSKSAAINEFKRMLDPFTQALKSLSSDAKPTINEVYIFRKKIEDHFKNAQHFSNNKIRNLALSLVREHFTMTNLHKIAVFLDPRFKSLKIMNHEDKANVLNMINKMISSEDSDNNVMTFGEENEYKRNSAQQSNKTNSSVVAGDNADSSKYLIEYMDIVEERDETHDEVELYMNLKFNDIYSTNILEFWEARYDLPHLRQLAREILCIPASGVVSEKIFTEDANLFAKRRLNMEIENIKQTLYIHENFDMLSNVL